MMPARLPPWTWLHAALLFLGHRSTAHPQGANDTQPQPVVNTPFGKVLGSYVSPNVAAFRGIPYAQAPVGDLRFEPPQPIEPPYDAESTTVDATQYGYRCIQHSLDFVLPVPLDASQENEDCLTVNVFVPKTSSPKKKKKKLPVFVWIYGGAWLEGYASAYDPSDIVEQFPDIIAVTFNYRLNIFGNPDNAAIGTEGTNPGLRDQQLAIAWVRDNIHFFDGDPSRIVLGGYSAGSASVLSYFYAYPNNSIAAGAFLFSGTAPLIKARNSTEFERVAAAVECRNAEDPQAELACMKTIEAGSLKMAISPNARNVYGNPYVSQNGGLPGSDEVTAFNYTSLAQRAQDGRFARVPVVIGDVEDEFDGLMPWTPRGINRTASDILTLTEFHCPTAAEARARSQYASPTWRFRYRGAFPSFQTYPWLRSFHGQDVTLLFSGHLYPPAERAATTYLRSALVAFVKDPKKGLSRFGWPKYDPNGPSTLVELFEDNNVEAPATFSDPRVRDEACQNPPPAPYAAVMIQPPPCEPCFD